MRKTLIAAATSAALLTSLPAFAREVHLEITNLTNALYFTPILIANHKRDTHLFRLGERATANLQAMAEGGSIDGLAADVESQGGKVVKNPADGLLGPGDSTTAVLHTKEYHTAWLSLTAMILPSNDGFVGLDTLQIPRGRGTYTYYLRGYDAGTETNDEVITGGGDPGVPGIPADPGGHAGSGGTGIAQPDPDTGADTNPYVHVHRGIVGDQSPMGGESDLVAGVHRFHNPIARLVLTVGGRR